MTFTESLIIALVAIWSVAFLLTVAVAVFSGDPDKRTDARKVLRMLGPPRSWILPHGRSTSDDDAAQ